MVGPAPIRRTKQFLNYGKLYLKDKIKILSINYNEKGDHHQGARYVEHFILGNFHSKFLLNKMKFSGEKKFSEKKENFP